MLYKSGSIEVLFSLLGGHVSHTTSASFSSVGHKYVYIHKYTNLDTYIYGIIEWSGVEGTFKEHLVEHPGMSRDIFY